MSSLDLRGQARAREAMVTVDLPPSGPGDSRPPGGDAGQPRTEDQARSLRGVLIKLAISAALLAILLYQADTARLWAQLRATAPMWIAVALALYLVMIVVSAWRWRVLLVAQRISVTTKHLVQSYLVATFFNNFLPSNIGGDVMRIKDTVRPAGSRTVATTVVLIDRGIGLLGLLVIGAVGATVAGRSAQAALPVPSRALWALVTAGIVGFGAMVLAPGLVSRLLHPLRLTRSAWVEVRLQRVVGMFERFSARPVALLNCFAGAVVVQALLVGFYWAVARSLHLTIPAAHLAVLVPLSFIVQMLPVSMNGLGVREATFVAYFRMLHQPSESALVLSLLATATVMAFSLSGAAIYATRR